jgi:hypothetical protein
VIALGVTWILDGLEVTFAGAISGVLQKPEALSLTDAEVGMSATFYLARNVFGALVFSFLTDRFPVLAASTPPLILRSTNSFRREFVGVSILLSTPRIGLAPRLLRRVPTYC